MNLSFESCIISEHSFPARQVQELVQNKAAVNFVLLDLLKLGEEINKLGQKKIALHYFSTKELLHWARFTLDKRKHEWLGGRLAAKYIAAKALDYADRQNIAPLWSDLEIMPDDNGRPFLSVNNEKTYSHLPDISISHSEAMAAAMAVSRGCCGIDIQKVTPRAVKVSERFCTPAEKHILHASFTLSDRETTVLTKLWAAKEALRKVPNLRSLPGFLELELIKIIADSSGNGQGPWKFIFLWKNKKHEVAVALIEDYALALTTMNDTVS